MTKQKNLRITVLIVTLLLLLTGCRGKAAEASASAASPTDSKVAVVYFSCTGNTERTASFIAEHTEAKRYRITPTLPYTSEDLDYGNPASRATAEQNDPSARPSLSGPMEDLEKYETVFLGYPIWWGQAPKIIYTFLERHDFSGKTIIPFCTSGSSDIGTSDTNLHALCADTVHWLPGKRFSATTSKEAVATWLEQLDD